MKAARTDGAKARNPWTGRVAKALMGRGRRSRLTILIYHRVHATRDEMSPEEVDAETFDWQIRCLRESFNVLSLDVAVDLLRRAELPPGSVCVTFDDGYRDNYDVALPVLLRHGVCATFFVTTGFLGHGIMFNDVVIECLRRTTSSQLDLRELGFGLYPLSGVAERRAAAHAILPKLKYEPVHERMRKALRLAELARVDLPSGLMMTPEQVRGLHRNGMGIGAHTVNHPILAAMQDCDASDEIEGSKRALEEIAGASVTLFAYPNGRPGTDYGRKHVAMVKELGFFAAVSTAPGIASDNTDTYQLPRFMPWDRSPRPFVARLVKNSFNENVVQV